MTDDFTRLLKEGAEHLLEPRRYDLLLPLLPCLLVLVLSGCGHPQEDTAAPPRPVRSVTAPAPAAPAALSLTGEVRAHDETALSFRLEGRVLTRRADIGMDVHAGEVLATIDSQTVANQASSAQADLASARSAGQLASLNLKRMRALMPSGAIARAQLDSAASDWQTAQSRIQSSEAALKTAQEKLRWTSLTAPEAGVITGVSVPAGQVVNAGQTVVTLASGNSLDVIVDVSDPGRIPRAPGALFRVALLTDPAVSASGHLRDISPQADPQTRTWRVRISLDSPPAALTLGSTVTVMLPGTGSPVIELPASSLTRQAGRPAVFVIDPVKNRLHIRPVVITRFSAQSVFISAGVTAGERVVIAGVSSLRDGERVAKDEEGQS